MNRSICAAALLLFLTVGVTACRHTATIDFEDFPATYRGPDESTWRVDDQGEFSPDFGILFLSQVRGGWLLGLTWAGAEGIDAYVLAADSSTSFREVEKAYRYTTPN